MLLLHTALLIVYCGVDVFFMLLLMLVLLASAVNAVVDGADGATHAADVVFLLMVVSLLVKSQHSSLSYKVANGLVWGDL